MPGALEIRAVTVPSMTEAAPGSRAGATDAEAALPGLAGEGPAYPNTPLDHPGTSHADALLSSGFRIGLGHSPAGGPLRARESRCLTALQ